VALAGAIEAAANGSSGGEGGISAWEYIPKACCCLENAERRELVAITPEKVGAEEEEVVDRAAKRLPAER